ncbi:MAG: cobalamin B12-binding domain-containing protein [Woeseiaceae bacterium]|jgi:MerR family transcriptional regulator, light-induced transcriptional regulator
MKINGPERPYSSPAQERFSDTEAAFGELSRIMLSRLSSTIEGDIIPRLMLAFDSTPDDAQALPSVTPLCDRLEGKVDEFVRLVLEHDPAVAKDYVRALRAEGFGLSSLYLDLLAPAARRLGEMWEEDECSFTDVTIGVCRLHEILLEFSRCFDGNCADDANGMSALIVPALGEQHTFGLFVLLEFLRRGGWNCWSGTPATSRDFRQLLRARSFDVVGVSVAADRHLDAVGEQIAAIRRHCGDDVVVLAGGRPFHAAPDLARELGADGTATDGPAAVRTMTDLCRKMKRKDPI